VLGEQVHQDRATSLVRLGEQLLAIDLQDVEGDEN
jgi:hypothetical protein